MVAKKGVIYMKTNRLTEKKNDIDIAKVIASRHTRCQETAEMQPNCKLGFVTKLLTLLSENDNSVICPYGIATVLAMVAEGASEESLQEILAALGYENLEELRKVVLSVQDVRCSAFTSDNSLVVKQGNEKMELLPSFRQIMTERYNSSITEQASDGEPSVELRNVAEFKAEWLYPMVRDASQVKKFRNADGSYSHPAYLSATKEFLRYYDDDFGCRVNSSIKAVALPYKLQDERIPYELVLVDSKNPLTEESLQGILSKMRLRKCKVVFPEFSIKNKYDLVPMMKKLGLENIFDEYNEAFDKIATVPLYAEKFSQEAEIEVDKNGTVAKAVTTMMLGKTMCMPEMIEELVFNKPFQYFLCNTTTGEIVFMGKVNKLSDCEKKQPIDVRLPIGSLRFWG